MSLHNQPIIDKTKWYKLIVVVSIISEMTSYVLFLFFLALAMYLPAYIQLQLTIAEDEIGFYILDPEDVLFWSLLLKIGLMVMSFYPLVIGVLLRLMRRILVSNQ